MVRAPRIIDAKIKDDGGPSRTLLSIYFEEGDRAVLPRADKSILRLKLDGHIYEGTISLRTSHPPYLLTSLTGPEGRIRCTDLFLEKGWNNGAALRFEVSKPGREVRLIKIITAGAPLPKRAGPSRLARKRAKRPRPEPMEVPALKALDPETLKFWAKRYWELIKPPDKREEVEFEREFQRAAKKGHLSRDLFIRVGIWKSPRNRARLESNAESKIIDTTRQAFQAASRKSAIRTLCGLNGVAARTSIAMLHWMRPDEFPMLDFRVVRALGVKQPANWEDLEYYEAFASRVLTMEKRLKVDLRTLDRALWAMNLDAHR